MMIYASVPGIKMGLNMVELVQVGPWPYLFDGTEKPTEHLSNRENQG